MCSLLLAGCTPKTEEVANVIKSVSLHEIRGEVFGSYYLIKYRGDLPPEKFKSQLESFFSQFNSEFSTYQSDSVISQLNTAPANKKLKISPRFIQMLELARKLHEDTQGAFDPTLAPIIKLWGFGGGESKGTPSDKVLKKAQENMGFSKIQWDAVNNEVWKTTDAVTLDVNGFAPGWAADLIAEHLEKHDIQNYMVDISGEILVKGTRSPNSGWIMGVEKPSANLGEAVQIAFRMEDSALATSGNYRQFYDNQGERYSHIIDPKTLRPVQHRIASASVIAPTAAEADAWSTAMMVLGEKGMNLAQSKGLKVYLIKTISPEKFESIFSPSMAEHMSQNPI